MTEPHLTLEQAQEIVKELPYPRVTVESIKDSIKAVRYLLDNTTTICIIEMKNGFKFIGTSTPADARNFDGEVGERYAYDNAFRQIWTHEGYVLRELIHKTEQANNV